MTERYEPDATKPEERLASSLRFGILPETAPAGDRDVAMLLEGLRDFRSSYRDEARLPSADATARMRSAIREAMRSERRRAPVFERAAMLVRVVAARPAWIAAAVVVVVALSVFVLRTPAPVVGTVARSADAPLVYRAPDGTVVTLRPHSRLDAIGADGARAYVLEGEAYFDVVRDVSKPFVVHAGDGVVTVLGTRFIVGSWGSGPSVFVDEGRVRFESRETRRSLILEAGRASALVDGTPEPASGIDRAVALDWMEGALVLDSQPFSEVVAEIEQHFDIRVTYPDGLAVERLTGRVLLQQRDQALLDLGIVVGGVFEATGPSAYRFVPD